jgi:hypothetical protein
MSEEQFWHHDTRLLTVYQKSYMRDKSYTAWLNGNYTATAFQVAYANCWSKGNKKQKYPNWKDPFERKVQNVSHETMEQQYRDKAVKQHNWLKKILKGG